MMVGNKPVAVQVPLIRPLEAADRAAWEPLWSGYLIFYQVELAPGVTATTWRRLLDPAEDMHGLCAVNAAGELVGFVHYLFHRVTWSITDRCYLEDLYVAEQARGIGVGRALIEAVYTAGDARGADQVYWLTQEFNTTARRLYDRVGQWTPFIKYRR
jgi:GNAT superfamily N-acetyltransferase